MAIREVLQFGNPLLREPCAAITDFEDPEVIAAQTDLRDTLHDLQRLHGKGGGLAAPQIGSSLQLLYVNARGRSSCFLNPTIVERSDETFEVWDFCFSANAAFLAQVTRNLRIRIAYDDPDGVRREEEFEGYFSELLQHEIDHLNGVLFVDHIEKPETLMMVDEWDKVHEYRQD